MRLSPDRHYFQHAGGTPFFWLGDTVWNGPLLSAADDPFIPARCIPRTANPHVSLEVWEKGGHLGFVEGPIFRPRFYAERRAAAFLEEHL